MMKVLKTLWAGITWPFKKVGQMFATAERFAKVEQKIDFTRELLDQKIEQTREVLDQKIERTREVLEVRISSLGTEMDCFRKEARASIGELASRIDASARETQSAIGHLSDRMDRELTLHQQVADLRVEIERLKKEA